MRIGLVGRPNTGKSSLFNQLTGMVQKTGNYPGVTMEKKSGLTKLAPNVLAEVVDLPGVYSLHPSSDDERVVMDALMNAQGEGEIDVVVGVADGTNLKTCLFVFTQAMDLGIPAVLVVTMADEMERRGMRLDVIALAEALGVEVHVVNTRKQDWLPELKASVMKASASPRVPFFSPPEEYNGWIDSGEGPRRYASWLRNINHGNVLAAKEITGKRPERLRADEAIQRYRQVNLWLREFWTSNPAEDRRWVTRVDRVIVHPVWGSAILMVILFTVFQLLFYVAEGPMNAIDVAMAELAGALSRTMPEGFISHLITHGLLPGLSGVLMFIPQIALLFGFIALLEESGYMSRVVFIMDRIMRPFGLSGKSVVPMVSGTACAIPAIMSTRNMENGRERLLAIAVAPFITCSARLPVYALIIGLVIPDISFVGLNARGLVFFGLYALGFLAALGSSALLNRILPKSTASPDFLQEMPEYRWPLLRNVGLTIYRRSKSFVNEAGRIIVAITVILWFAASFGPNHHPDFTAAHEVIPIEESYVGIAGKFVEPLVAPLGYDWKISVAIVSSFVAREVFVGTMAMLYAVGDEGIQSVSATLAQQIRPGTDEPMFTLALGVSLLLFYAFAMQCMSTLVVVAREARSWKLALAQFFFMGALAYLFAWAAFMALS